MALPQPHRLRAHQEIERILRSVRPHRTDHFSIRVTSGNMGAWQAAVLVPVFLVPTAVQRHQIKRQVLEVVQQLPLPPGVHLVISVTRIPGLETTPIHQEILLVLRKSGILGE